MVKFKAEGIIVVDPMDNTVFDIYENFSLEEVITVMEEEHGLNTLDFDLYEIKSISGKKIK